MSTYAQRFCYGDLEPPLWLNTKFFETFLRKCNKNETIKLIYFEIGPATHPGDNFTSIMFRASMDYKFKVKVGQCWKNEENKISFIIKTPPPFADIDEQCINKSIFEIEIKMYTVTLPEIQRLMEMAGDEKILTPR